MFSKMGKSLILAVLGLLLMPLAFLAGFPAHGNEQTLRDGISSDLILVKKAKKAAKKKKAKAKKRGSSTGGNRSVRPDDVDEGDRGARGGGAAGNVPKPEGPPQN